MSPVMTGAGLAAMASIVGLLLIEEIGVPLPMFPADGLLIAAGVLAGTGAVRWWIIVPLLILVDIGGAAIGYAWVRGLGRRALYRVAGRLGATVALERVSGHLQAAGAAGVFVTRLIPGTRVYTNLVAGAMDMEPRQFLMGMLPASAVWVTAVTSIGILIGDKAARYVAQFEQFSLEALIGLAIALACYFALRRIPRRPGPGLLLSAGAQMRTLALGLVIDFSIVAAAVVGVLVIELHLAGMTDADGVLNLSLVVGGAAITYIAITRLGIGATVGEKLLGVSYRPSPRPAC